MLSGGKYPCPYFVFACCPSLCCGLHHDAMIGAESHAHFLKNNITLSDALAADAEAGCG